MDKKTNADNKKANLSADPTLQGNEEIERSIEAVQLDPTDERLAYALTVIRRRMKAKGHLIVSVETQINAQTGEQIALRLVNTPDGKKWFAAFTGYEEQSRGGDSIQSAFTAEIGKLFEIALSAEGVDGVIINPWNRTIILDRELIRIIIG